VWIHLNSASVDWSCKKKWTGILLLCAFVLLVHGGALKNEFYWDDRPIILEGHFLRSIHQIPPLFFHEFWYHVDQGERAPRAKLDTYRPVYNLSFQLDHFLWAKNPIGFHLTNLIYHLFNVLLVFAIGLQFLRPEFAWMGALIFSVHPLALEPVHYVSARADSLSCLFSLLATWIGFKKKDLQISHAFQTAFFYFCGILVKESILFFPLVWMIVFWIQDFSRHKIKFFALTLGVTGFFYLALRSYALKGAKAVASASHLFEIFFNFPRCVIHFISSFFIPLHNMPMQPFKMLNVSENLLFWVLPWIFYPVFIYLMVFIIRKKYKCSMTLLWVVLALLPAFFATSMTEVMNPRYYYAPLTGMVIFTALLFDAGVTRKLLGLSFSIVSLGVLAFIFGLISKTIAGHYRTGELFYRKILEDTPHHVEAEYNLANTLYRENNLREAQYWYHEVLRHQPGHVSALNNLGLALKNQNQPTSAIPFFKKAIELRPNEARYHYNLALSFEQLGNMREARIFLERAVKLDPHYSLAKTKLRELSASP